MTGWGELKEVEDPVVDYLSRPIPGFDDWINLVEIGFDVSRPGGWLERKPLV